MELFLLFPLILMIYQDFTDRHVLLWQLLLFGVIQLFICFNTHGLAQSAYNMMINLIISTIIASVVFLYTHFRFKLEQPVIGSGDIIFILLLAPYFSYFRFLYFLIISFLLALASWQFKVFFYKERVTNIPLISYLGICYIIVVMYNLLFNQ